MIMRGEIPDHLIVMDGYDYAIIGVAEFWTSKGRREAVAYDVDKCIKILTEDGMTYDEALEYFDYNIAGAYVGEHTPVFIYT